MRDGGLQAFDPRLPRGGALGTQHSEPGTRKGGDNQNKSIEPRTLNRGGRTGGETVD
ncbi:MAG: hypothetical protein DDT25_01166 [Chloroflexi bacterium]|nr:hypothetical protein [Chloroflexota bacterium]